MEPLWVELPFGGVRLDGFFFKTAGFYITFFVFMIFEFYLMRKKMKSLYDPKKNSPKRF